MPSTSSPAIPVLAFQRAAAKGDCLRRNMCGLKEVPSKTSPFLSGKTVIHEFLSRVFGSSRSYGLLARQSAITVPMLTRWRGQISEPVEELKR